MMSFRFDRPEADPLSHRKLSDRCWNGHHDPVCPGYMCDCLCHGTRMKRQKERRPDQLDVEAFGTIEV
jgi:hypothetical protein